MDRNDSFPIWMVLLGVAAGGAVAFLVVSPRGKSMLRSLPHTLRDLAQQSQRALSTLRDVAAEIEQSLQKVEAALEQVEEALQQGAAEVGASSAFEPRAA